MASSDWEEFVDLNRDDLVHDCNNRITFARGLLLDSEEHVRSIGLHLGSIRGTVERCRRSIRHARKTLILATEKVTTSELEHSIAVSIKENMTLDSVVAYKKMEEISIQVRCLRLTIFLLGEEGQGGFVGDKIRETKEKIEDYKNQSDALDRGAEHQSNLAKSFELGAVTMKKYLWDCAKTQKTTRLERLDCLRDCLEEMKGLESRMEGSLEEVVRLRDNRLARVGCLEQELLQL